MSSDLQTVYKKALRFAAGKHSDQKEKGTQLPYLVHLCTVASEIMIAASYSQDFNIDFAITVALLHDVLEDTITEEEEITREFGMEVSKAVLALTKSKSIKDKEERLLDSITRIKAMPKEVWAVKLAD